MNYDYSTPGMASAGGDVSAAYTPLSSLDPRTQVLGSLAEVFGRYSRPTNDQYYPEEEEENESIGRHGDISDAARLEKVWSHARQELKEKERELNALQSRSLAEASMARTGTVLKEALANQLAEERDRARFLELQLAELVSQHEHLKTQYSDSLTKLGESLKVRVGSGGLGVVQHRSRALFTPISFL
jgi:hypothetical protein